MIYFKIVLFFTILSCLTCAVEDSDDSEDKVAKTVFQAVLVPEVSKIGEEVGKGWGDNLTNWVINRINAPKPGSYLRKLAGWTQSGNMSDQWSPVGQKVGGVVCEKVP